MADAGDGANAGPPLLALVGPTATGKTEAAVVVAEAIGAEVVAVDSTLVYRGMDVGTSKPTAEQCRRIPHHLIDLAEPTEAFSVAEFQRLAREAVGDIRRRGRRPLLVSGGGLYLRALVDELEFPATDASTRALLESEAAMVGGSAMHERLRAVDPAAAARIDPPNVRRTVRALEVAAVTARPFSHFAEAWERYPSGGVRIAGVRMPRETLHARIERRAAAQMDGLLEETRRLVERGSGPFLTAWQAIGYAESVAVLEGRLADDEALRSIVRRTKALARRQLAWLRRDPRIRWFDVGERGAIEAAGTIAAYLTEG